MQLVFIGIQGSGKGTQARILAEKYGFVIFETGEALRNLAKQNSELGKLVKSIIEAGKQVPSKVIEMVLDDFIKTAKGKNIIFDGLVRNIENKQVADKKLNKDYKVIYFDLPEQKAIERLLGRMYNPKTGETFPAGTTIDPKTGDKLIKRPDDKEEVIKQRIKEFYKKTLPLVEIYKKEGKLITINANQSVEKVTEEIISKLNL